MRTLIIALLVLIGALEVTGQSVRPAARSTNSYTLELDLPGLRIDIPTRRDVAAVCTQGGSDPGRATTDYHFTYTANSLKPFREGVFTRRGSSVEAETRADPFGTRPNDGESFAMTIEGYSKNYQRVGPDCEITFTWRNTGSVLLAYEDFAAVGVTARTFCVDDAALNDLNSLTTYTANWSGPGVSGTRFTPSSAGAGTHTIRGTRSYTNGTSTINFTFTVVGLPSVNASGNFTRCVGDADVILGGTPSGGTWSGNGVVSGSAFDPSRAGVGNHTLTYTYSNANGCTNSDSRVATVGAIPNVNAGSDFDVCLGDFQSLSGSPAGGTWSGPGVVGNSFNSTLVGSGSHTLTYSYTSAQNCTDTDQVRARVNSIPTVDAGSDDQRCISSASVSLSGTPSGGTWSGPGMSGNTFRPNIAGLGNHLLTYSFTDGNGCSNSDTKRFAVVAAPTVNAGSNQTVCIDDARFFVGGFTPTGGTWSGPGINSSGRFDPDDSGIGTHTLTYNWSDGSGCSGSDTKTITVRGLPSVNAGSNITYCVGSGRYTQTASPSGGSWSGQGMSGNRFDTDIVGPGNYTITYTYTDASGCSNSDSKVVTIQGGPAVQAGSDQTVCTTSLSFSLSGTSPAGGSWDSHPGISGNTFIPANAGVGTHILRYRYTNPFGCDGFDSKTVNVLAQPTISVGSDISACVSDPTFLITGSLPSGGDWSGDGVVGSDRFDPSLAGVGTHTITYTYTNAGGCSNSATKDVVVTGLATVDAGVDLNRCINAGILTLSGEFPLGGTWSGPGVVNGNEFNPVLAGLGVHGVVYSYADGNGCTATDIRTVIVDNADPIDAGRNQLACITDAPFPLDGASESGGTWSGSGVVGNLFDASIAGVGTHELTYDFVSLGGCFSSDITFITVVANDAIDAGDPVTVCVNAGFFNLQNGVSVTGGSFSGNGVVSNAFDPSLAGIGMHTITYQVTNPNGCLTSDTRDVTVIDPAPVDIGADITFCVSDTPYDLMGDATVTGGSFSGLGVVGTDFDPTLVGAGAFEISYEVDDANGCSSVDTRIIYVTSPGEVDAGQNFAVCAGSGSVDLSQNASPNTGLWTGPAVTGNIFDPSLLTSGDYVLRYTISNGFGCDAFDEILVTVTDVLVIDAGADQEVCEGGEALDLYTVVSIPGGEFVGENMSGNIFDVQRADPGTYAITYNYSNEFGCNDNDVVIITVNALPNVVAGSDLDVCLNQNNVDLRVGAIPSGGTFEGAGVIGDFFNPSIAGIGRHDVFYTFTNVNGCASTEVREITVKDLPEVEVGNNLVLCVDQGAYDLGQDVDPAGGSWTGSGIDLSNFDPLVAGIGIHELTYTVALPSGCSNSAKQFITVVEPESVFAGDDLVVCTSSNSIDLSASATPFGGVFDGVGVTGRNFRPGQVNPGEYTITYTYNSAGCDVTDTRKITVTDIPNINAGPNTTVCISQDPIDASAGTFPTGGILSGPGLIGNFIDPSIAGIGDHVISYTYASPGGCIVTDEKTFTVQEAPSINAGNNISHCINAGQLNLSLDVSESGGVFFGTGVVSGGIFDPLVAGIGTHEMTYTFSEGNGCISMDTRLITVINLPILEIGGELELCRNAGSYPLLDDVNILGGEFEGPGVNGNVIEPSELNAGSYNIEYRLATPEGCVVVAERRITIVDPVNVDAGPAIEICLGESVDLNLSVSIAGGTFVGSGVTGNVFSSTAAGLGVHEVNYSLIDGNSCEIEDTRQIMVVSPILIDAGDNVSICYDDGQYNLFDDVDEGGGYFIGNGIVGGFFDPQIAGEGVHILTYRLESSPDCISEDTKVITVTRPIQVMAGDDLNLCIDDGVYNLASDVNLSGGIFNGIGVEGSGFDPSEVSPGSYTITYSREDAQGCLSSDERIIIVNQVPDLNIGQDIELCLNSSPINLALPANLAGGVFVGPGVTGNFFDPFISGVGSHVIRYDYSNPVTLCSNSVTRRIDVVLPEVVAVPPTIIECIDGSIVDLNREDGVIDGTIFSGPGISNNNFFPSVAGAGIHVLTATLDVGNGCSSVRTFEAIVSELPDLDFGANMEVCIDEGLIDLSQEVNFVGGQFTGTGVSDNNFNPANAGPGTFVITYDYSDGNGCSNSITKSIRVNALADLVLGGNRSTCIGAGTIDLGAGSSPSGGSWSGNGINIANVFDPVVAGVGVHVATYLYVDPVTGCENSDMVEIVVDDAPNIEVPNELRLCLSDPKIDLRDLDDIVNGTQFSGTGVTSNEFNPTIAGIGIHVITASISISPDCSNTTIFDIIVSEPTVLDFGVDLTMCTGDGIIDLSNEVNILGGIFSGNGVSGSLFNPEDAGFGRHTLDYSFTNVDGCTSRVFKVINVNASPDIGIDDDEPRNFCIDSNRLNLLTLSSDAGVWSGNGVTGIYFDPVAAGIGDHWAYLTANGSAGCSTIDSVQFSVNDIPSVTFDPSPIALCSGGNKLDLSSYVNVAGGVFSGAGMDDALFDPTETGIGVFTISYTYENGLGCSATATKTIEVTELPVVGAGNDRSLCLNQGAIDLTIGSFPLGGVYSGAGVTGTQFDPSQAGIGSHVISYTYTDANGCSGRDERVITINDGTELTVGPNFVMCTEDNFYDLNQDVSPLGGTWSGSGITLSNFYPLVAGEGVHQLTYTFIEAGGCTATAQRTVTVVTPGGTVAVDAGPDITVCNSASIVDLSLDATPVGGIFQGIGVNGVSFDPGVLVPGIYTITYNIDNGGCSSSGSRRITIVQDPLIEAGADAEVCVDQTSFDLSIGSFPSGGSFVGAGVSGTDFNPAAAGLGTHQIRYVYDDPSGCQVSDTRTFIVSGPIQIDAGDDIIMCIGDASINLLEGTSENSGEFTGAGVVLSRFFDPSISGVGNHVLTYSYTNSNGCISQDTRVATVLDIPGLDAGPDIEVCQNSASINLIRDVSRTGGEFTGFGINNGFFEPNELNPGVYTIEYSIENAQGCLSTATREITVVAPPVVNVEAAMEICIDASNIDLSASGTPLGGSWTGAGINVSNMFEPTLAGIGEHELTYTYIDPISGCAAIDIMEVRVVDIPESEVPSNMLVCASDAAFNLSELDEAINGVVFSGNGVMNDIFNPFIAGQGSHTITMSIDFGAGCANAVDFTIIVNPTTNVDFGGDLVLCSNNDPINLISEVNVIGGEFTGQGVDGSVFDPSEAGFGTHILTYTYENAGGCISTDIKVVTVNTVSDVVIDESAPIEICINGDRVVLNALSNSQGEWSGNGVSGVYFEPSIAGVGDHWVKLTAQGQGGCSDADSLLISVYDVPVVTFDSNPVELCAGGSSVNMNSLVSVTGGIFSGIGVDDNLFDPMGLAAGTYTVTYDYATARGCSVSITKDVEVLARPVVNAGADTQRCVDAPDIDLSISGTPLGGSWTGPGISLINTFEPALAGIGEHELTYTYTEPVSGCSASDIMEVSVVAIPQLEEPSTIVVCASDPSVNLKELDEATSGVSFSGTGVTNGIFSPSVAGQGNHVITMAIDLGAGCANSLQFTIIVNPTTTVDFGSDLVLCSNEDPINLVSEVNVVGGQFSGQGVVGSVFDPATAGFGTHIITYTYENIDGCTSSDIKVITVNTVTDVVIDDDTPIETCVNGDRIVLSGLSDGQGEWSGSGVSGVYFEPSIAGVGDHWVKLTSQGQGGCSDADSLLISVYDVPVVEFSVEPVSLCAYEAPFNLNSLVNITGGEFSGIGVSSGYFDPTGLAAGDYEVDYLYTTLRGCNTETSKTITVLEQPIVSAGSDFLVCLDVSSIDLASKGTPLGGIWTGPGINVFNTFEPALAGAGTHTIRYTYIDGVTGCANSDILDILVEQAPVLESPAAVFVCEDDAPLRLSDIEGVTAGVTFTGIGVQNGTFDPSIAGQGNAIITMSYDEGNGCIVSTDFTIVVNPVPVIDFGEALTLCVNEASIDLVNEVNVIGGTFSGNGVIGSVFDPSIAGFGTHIIIYQYQLEGGCITIATKTITVQRVELVTIDDNAPIDFCENDERLLLATLTSDQGEWTGAGVSGLYFNPAVAGIGDHWVKLSSVGDGNCVAADSVLMTVNAVPSVSFINDDVAVCEDGDRISLVDLVNVTGGIFSGIGVEGNFFDPEDQSAGIYIIDYVFSTAQGCEVISTKSIEILPVPVVNAGADITKCIDASVIDLSSMGTPTGGMWQGAGINGANVFDPVLAGIGEHELVYTYVEPTARCSASDQLKITVEKLPVLERPNTIVVCSSDAPLNLRDLDGAATGVRFAGAGVENDIFNPNQAGPGSHTIVMSINDGEECYNEVAFAIVVNAVSNLDFGESMEVCANDEAIDLVAEVNLIGGVFTGTGLVGSVFDPRLAGFGTHVVRYEYINESGCLSFVTKVISVSAIDEVIIDDDENIELCINDERLILSSLSSSVGQWSGNGVEGVNFEPLIAGVGDHWISLRSEGQAGCTDADSILISVFDIPAVAFLPEPINLCEGDERLNLSGIVNIRGGEFEGEGVQGNFLETEGLTSGSYEVSYTYTTPRDCNITLVKEINVVAVPIVDGGIDLERCIGADPIDLSALGTPLGGTWSGRGINDINSFEPLAAGIGVHELMYYYSDPITGCGQSDIIEISVLEEPILEIPEAIVICSGDGIVNLRELEEAPRGAVFSGFGVSEGVFDPVISGVGIHRLTMAIDNGNGCVTSVGFNAVVNTAEDVDFGEDLVLCTNDLAIDLITEVNVIGGVFEGRGISGTIFDPEIGGFGTHVLRYEFLTDEGCRSSDVKIVTVNQVDEVILDNEPISMCISDERLVLSGLSTTSGTWTGNGVSGIHFDPTNAGEGDHWVRLTSTGLGGCGDVDSLNITVFGIPEVAFNEESITICEDENTIDLSGLVSMGGGVFSGPGVDGTLFDPTETGTGTFGVNYTLGIGGLCERTITKEIIVIGLPNVQAGSDVVVCLDSAMVNLSIGAFPAGGSFEGPGVEGNEFNPILAGAGVHTIVYSYQKDGASCLQSATKEVEVLSADRVFAGPNIELCISGAALDLSESVSPRGGVFFGEGVNGNFFYPSSSGVGEYEVSYVITSDRGCVSTAYRTVVVNEERLLDVGMDRTVCINDSPIILDQEVSIPGGDWSGRGIVSNVFNVDSAGVGTHILTYVVTTGDGCELEATKIMKVNDVNRIEIGGNLSSCLEGDRINLIGNFNTDFVRITGPGVIGGFEFDPAEAGTGTHAILYEFLNDNGCVYRDERYITVAEDVFVAVDRDFALCQGAGEIDLTDKGYPRGEGVWIGNGVESNGFDPSGLDPGRYELEYRVDLGFGCSNAAFMNIDVVAGDITGFGRDTILCVNTAEIELNNEELLGGNWNGIGVINNKFYPSQSGPGEFLIEYTNDDYKCDIVGRRKITVVDIPELAAVEEYDIAGCRGDVVRFTANVVSNNNAQVINYEWYKEGEEVSFARGKSINYVLDVNENIYFRSVNQFGCTSNQADFIRLTVNGAFGFIEVDQDTVDAGDLVRFKSVVSNAEGYYWNFGDGNFSTEPNPVYIYHTPGNKNVSLNLTSPDGCEFLIEEDGFINIVGLLITGLEETNIEVMVYPVPVQDHLTVEVDNDRIVEWELHDLNGRSIDHKVVPGLKELSIDVRGVNIGTYMLMLRTQSGGIVIKKIVKE